MNREKPRLTIAIPTYHRAELVGKCVARVLRQAPADVQILVVDNGSPDNTQEALQPFADDPRIKIRRNPENLGIDANILRCCEESDGEYVFFLSDEDHIPDGGIRAVLKAIDTNLGCGVVYGSIIREGPDEEFYFQWQPGVFGAGRAALRSTFLKHTYISGLTLRIASLRLIKAKAFDGCLYMHLVLAAQASARSGAICTSHPLAVIGQARGTMDLSHSAPQTGGQTTRFNQAFSRVLQFNVLSKLRTEAGGLPPSSRSLAASIIARKWGREIGRALGQRGARLKETLKLYSPERRMATTIPFWLSFVRGWMQTRYLS